MNRPGLSKFAYRIGDYASFRQKIFEKINRAPALKDWTYRGSDDPGIAILEGGAMVADVLTAYQEVYANESYLQTAQWDQSVSGIARLLGDKASPGVGGRCFFSVEIRKGANISVPKGFLMTSDLEGFKDPVDWETENDLTLVPELSRLRFEKPIEYKFSAGGNTIGGAGSELSVPGAIFPNGLPSMRIFVSENAADLEVFKIPTPASKILTGDTSGIATVSKVQDRYHLSGVVITKAAEATKNARSALMLGVPHEGTNKSVSLFSTSDVDNVFVFEGTDASIVPGDHVLLKNADNFYIRRVEQVRFAASPANENAKVYTLLSLDRGIYPLVSAAGTLAISGMAIFKILSPWFAITDKTPTIMSPAEESTAVEYLVFKGEAKDSVLLDGRKVGFIKEAVSTQVTTLKKTNTPNLFQLNPPLFKDNFNYDDFLGAKLNITILGNILECSQGKTEPETAIGSGDFRKKFQTFAIPKMPLTYFPSPDDPAQLIPELEVRVQGRLWSRVESFLSVNETAEVFIVREDIEGKSWVQFGDGIQGAKLPTGPDNVTAIYRVGQGARGRLQRDTQPRSGEKIDRLEKIRQLGEAWGGQKPVSSMLLKKTTPQKVRALGRLVSLDDYEMEVRKIPGVLQVRASWGGDLGNPQNMDFLVFAEANDPQTQSTIRETILKLDRQMGLQRLNVNVNFGRRVDAYLSAMVYYDPKAIAKPVLETLTYQMLGVWSKDQRPTKTGLFSMDQRSFGQNEYQTRVQGVLQNIPGVVKVDILHFGVYKIGATLDEVLNVDNSINKTEAAKTAIDPIEWLALRKDQTLIDWKAL